MLALLTFDVDAESPVLAHGRRYARWPSVMSHQQYGPRVAVPRLLALLDEYALAATFFFPGWTVDRHPHAVERVLASGHEICHHGYSHLSPVALDEQAERADLERGLAALERHDVHPAGYRTPNWEPSERTFDLLVEYGFAYDSSLMDDDRPYLLAAGAGDLVELPVHWGLDDWNQFNYLPEPATGYQPRPPSHVADLWRWELDAAARHGVVFVLTMHPFVTGRPGRVEALRTLVEHALDRGDVEFVAGAEAARRARADPELRRREVPLVDVDLSVYPYE